MSRFVSRYPIAVVGGGIAGLSAAWYLQQAGIEYVLLEAGQRWGGKIRTEQVEGYGPDPFVIEGGPDSFITQKPWGLALAQELGLAAELIGTNPDRKQTYVLQRGRPLPLPDGVMLLVPTKLKPFLLSPLLSPWGKLRMGLDLFLPPRRDDGDETLAEFVQRRLGREALERIAEPLLSGIYNAEADKQSLLATFPRFREIEQQYGSLTRGMLAQKARRRNDSSGQPSPSFFVAPRDGMETLVEALVARLTGEHRTGTSVVGLEPLAGGYRLHRDDGAALEAERLILATPAYVTARLLQPLAPDAAALLASIRYVGTGTVSLAFRRDEVAYTLKGYGLVIPLGERRPINAVTFSSVKFARRAPAGYELVRVFFGGSRSPQTMELDDAALLTTVRRELEAILGLGAEPLFFRIYRWPQANPQYDVGHLERVAAIEAALPQGIWVIGSAYRGVGIPDCIRQGREAATAVVGHMGWSERVVG